MKAESADFYRGYHAGLERAAMYHEAQAADCRAIAAVNRDNEMGSDCETHAIDHDIAADEIRAISQATKPTQKPPYPFCRTPDKCSGKGYCPRDIACND